MTISTNEKVLQTATTVASCLSVSVGMDCLWLPCVVVLLPGWCLNSLVWCAATGCVHCYSCWCPSRSSDLCLH